MAMMRIFEIVTDRSYVQRIRVGAVTPSTHYRVYTFGQKQTDLISIVRVMFMFIMPITQ